jgi:hypothetical protein
MVISGTLHKTSSTSSITEYTHRSSVIHKTTKPTMDSASQDTVTIDNENRPDENINSGVDEERYQHNCLIQEDTVHQDAPNLVQSPELSRQDMGRDIRDRDSTLKTESPSENPSVNTWSMDDDFDDMSVASGHSYATYDTNATSESVQDIITRLQSETDRRRRRLLRRRQMRNYQNRKNSDRLQKYNSRPSSYVDPKLGITVEIKENP